MKMHQDTSMHPQNQRKVKQKLTGHGINQVCKTRNTPGGHTSKHSSPVGAWKLDSGAWESPLAEAKFGLIHSERQCGGTQRMKLSNSACNRLAANLSSFFFFSWSQKGGYIPFSELCLWLIRNAGVLHRNLRGGV